MKPPVLSIYSCKRQTLGPVVVFLLAVIVWGAFAGPAASGQTTPRSHRMIVLDPGHGGHDAGATGEGNVHEKDMTLAFARILSDTLKHEYSVRLTRADDYQMAPVQRTALANHLSADLFISLHTGASVLHNPHGMLIAFNDDRFRLLSDDPAGKAGTAHAKGPLPAWRSESSENMDKSLSLAEILKERLLNQDPTLKIDILGMPLIVLQGADCPSLLIEIGYITNPADLQNMQYSTNLAEYAEIIASALEAYFSSHPQAGPAD